MSIWGSRSSLWLYEHAHMWILHRRKKKGRKQGDSNGRVDKIGVPGALKKASGKAWRRHQGLQREPQVRSSGSRHQVWVKAALPCMKTICCYCKLPKRGWKQCSPSQSSDTLSSTRSGTESNISSRPGRQIKRKWNERRKEACGNCR